MRARGPSTTRPSRPRARLRASRTSTTGSTSRTRHGERRRGRLASAPFAHVAKVIAMPSPVATGQTTGDAQAAEAGQPSSATARPSRRSIVMRALLLIAIVLVVFVGILPRVVDYDAVRAALSSLSTTQLAVLIVATAIAYVANAVPSRILIPALSWPHAVGADLAARAVVSTIPGPTDVATRFVLYRQWGIPDDT